MQEVATQIDPSKTPHQVLEDLEKDHPPATNYWKRSRPGGEAADFIVEKKIITIPSPVLPILEETPAFERALTSASMDTPGAFKRSPSGVLQRYAARKGLEAGARGGLHAQLQPRHHL